MKKAIKILVSILEAHQKGEKKSLGKEPKAVFLVCPGHFAPLTAEPESLLVVENAGAALSGAEEALDRGIRRQKLPLLVIVAAQNGADFDRPPLKGDDADVITRIGKKETLAHLDRQVATALDRYGDLVKKRQLMIVGIYDDGEGGIFIANYNGLKGKDALSYSLPDVGEDFFLK